MAQRSKTIDRLIEHIRTLNSDQIEKLERFVFGRELNDRTGDSELANKAESASQFDWPHAPLHRLSSKGTYIVTAGTFQREHFFARPERLDFLQSQLLSKAEEHGWQIEAWAIFSNHYHFVGHAGGEGNSLRQFLAHLHADTAREINKADGKTGRQIWFNFWDTELTFEKSYFARLNYVHQNPVKHGLVPVANRYRWCSAAWFERTANPSQVKTIYSFKTDKVNVVDEFDVLAVT